MVGKTTTIHAGLEKLALQLKIILGHSGRCLLEILDLMIITVPYHRQVYF